MSGISTTWDEWRAANEDDIWHLFWALSRSVEDMNLPMLDQLDFHRFMAFCQKNTSHPAAHPDLEAAEKAQAACGANNTSIKDISCESEFESLHYAIIEH